MEQWRDIPGYEGIYQASNFGNIRTCEGKTTYTERHGIRHWKQRILRQKQTMNRKGRVDARVSLWKDGSEKTWLVSRLVGLAWCAGYADGMTINHMDGNPLNNSADNLEWIPLSENIRHGFRNGLYGIATQTVLISVRDQSQYEFVSQIEASRFLGRTNSYINTCLKNGRNARNTKGETFYIA